MTTRARQSLIAAAILILLLAMVAMQWKGGVSDDDDDSTGDDDSALTETESQDRSPVGFDGTADGSLPQAPTTPQNPSAGLLGGSLELSDA